MKTFYSILSAVINPVSGEKISLGLVLSDGNTSIFDYSRNRLSLINSLINPESKKFIKQYIKSIESIINRIDINQDQHSIFDVEGKNLVINESYIGYLSTYSQNVISFSKPVSIDLKIEKGIFAALYSKFIDEETEASKTENKVHLAKSSFFPQIKNHFSTDKEFTAEYDSSVILPIKIDLIGKNEIYVIGQFLDLEKSLIILSLTSMIISNLQRFSRKAKSI